MIEETATVQSADEHWVNVVTTQSSSCHQCNESETCSTSVLSKFFGNKEIKLKLHSTINLKKGDKVTIGIDEKVFVGLTCLIYLAPLVGLLLFAVLGRFVEEQFNIANELPTILFALFGFVGCYYGIKLLISNFFEPNKINPVILKKL